LYQGDELGLSEAQLPFEALQDPVGITFWQESKGRDGCRTPMPWKKEAQHAGFTSGVPWLPISKEHVDIAVSEQERDPDSVLQFARKVIRWRKSIPQLLRGEISFYPMPEPLLALRRDLPDAPGVLVVFNLGHEAQEFEWDAALNAITLSGHGLAGVKSDRKIQLPAYGAWFGIVRAGE
jgi:alpha-glucosidase